MRRILVAVFDSRQSAEAARTALLANGHLLFEDYPGTGVGLAIVRKAVERMHGKVWAESAKGAGATFWIRLPEARAAA